MPPPTANKDLCGGAKLAMSCIGAAGALGKIWGVNLIPWPIFASDGRRDASYLRRVDDRRDQGGGRAKEVGEREFFLEGKGRKGKKKGKHARRLYERFFTENRASKS